MKLLVCMIQFSLPIVPILQLTLLTFAPCTPPFILSMQPNCTGSRVDFSLVGIGIHLFETWMSLHMMLSAGVCIVYSLLVCTVCILTYLSILDG